jgi:succinate dehydrogenase/fumarate reductase flavoprotein subunit
LVSGRSAGSDAAIWSKDVDFGGASQIEEAVNESLERIDKLKSAEGLTVGDVTSKLAKLMEAHHASDSGQNGSSTLEGIKGLIASGIGLTDKSSNMNTELVSAIKLEGLLSIAEAIAESG